MNDSSAHSKQEERENSEQANMNPVVPVEHVPSPHVEWDEVDAAMAPRALEPDASAYQPEDEEPAEEPLPVIGKTAGLSAAQEPTMKAAKRCHVGAVRERNEDSCLIFTTETGGHFPLLPFGLYIVADGMGGHKNGHVASKVASRVAANHIINKIYMPLLQNEGMPGQTPVQEVLEDAVAAAHRALYDPEEDRGTTLSVALVLGRRLYVAHVGDTRIYLHTDDKLEMVTTDHSLVKRLQDVGQLTAEEATYYQYRHVLLRAVGQGEDIEIDTYTRLLPQTGKLLLCTDGLCGLVADAEIETIMRQDVSVRETVNQLFEAAMEAGGYDNITAIVVDFNL